MVRRSLIEKIIMGFSVTVTVGALATMAVMQHQSLRESYRMARTLEREAENKVYEMEDQGYCFVQEDNFDAEGEPQNIFYEIEGKRFFYKLNGEVLEDQFQEE